MKLTPQIMKYELKHGLRLRILFTGNYIVFITR